MVVSLIINKYSHIKELEMVENVSHHEIMMSITIKVKINKRHEIN